MARNLVRFDPFAELTALQKQFFSAGLFASPRTADIGQGALVIQAEKHVREADDDHVQATFENGVLKITVPFRELPSPKKVAITATPSPSAGAPGTAPQAVNAG